MKLVLVTLHPVESSTDSDCPEAGCRRVLPQMSSSLPAESELAESDRSIYGLDFWLAFLANLLLISANALVFRFADYVALLGEKSGHVGGTEELSGWIVSLGMAAALVMRLWLGQGIDRYGARAVWLMTGFLYLAGCLGFMIPVALASPVIWLSRVAYQVGMAGMFACSMVNIQNQVHPSRRTEIIGSLGTSGFIGLIIGTQCGDLLQLLPAGNPLVWFGSPRYGVIFGLSALFGVLHMVVVLVLTRGDVHVRPSETPHALKLLFRHWPGGTVWVAIAHGVVFSVTTVFLTRYVAELKLEGIGVFFLGYAIVAFVSRWTTREWGQKIGRHTMLIRGLISMVAGLLLLLPVKNQWMLVPSAMACGFGAALIFPALLSLGAGRFPVHHRGTGTTLVLGFIDLGTIVASPILGRLIDFGNVLATREKLDYEHLGFTLMLSASATLVLVVLVYYWLVASRVPDVDHYESETIESPVPGGLASGPVVVEEEREFREDEFR